MADLEIRLFGVRLLVALDKVQPPEPRPISESNHHGSFEVAPELDSEIEILGDFGFCAPS